MQPTILLYQDLAYVFAAALAGGLLARRFGQPLILGYVLAGILIGPFTPGPRLSNGHVLEMLAEIGVILLMFSIGIEFSLRDLLQVKRIALIGGPIGIVLIILLSTGVGGLLGWSLHQGVVIGATLCVASTMVMSRLLMDRGELTSPQGQIMIGITLIEDLAVVLFTVLFRTWGGTPDRHLTGVLMDIVKSALVLVPAVLLAAKWVPALMSRVGKMRNPELYILVILALGFTTAAATQALGLSLALGAFLGGMVISGTTVAKETLQRLQPLRDAFVALFFVTVGALIDPRMLVGAPALLAVLTALIVIGKFMVWAVIVWLFKYPLRTALLAAAGLTQIGEFSYVLAQVARQHGLFGDPVYNAVLAASLVSILLNAFLMRWLPRWLPVTGRA